MANPKTPRKRPAKPAASPAPSAPPATSTSSRRELAPGTPVTFTYQDAGGNDLHRVGLVVRVTDEHDPGGPKGAVVAWLGDLSDPIPLDDLARVD